MPVSDWITHAEASTIMGERLDEKISKDEIMRCIKSAAWQKFRKSLKGLSTKEKLSKLRGWKRSHPGRCGTVQVQNYINALKRGGQIK